MSDNLGPQNPNQGSDPTAYRPIPPQGYGPPPGQVPPQGYGPPLGQVPPQGYGPPQGHLPPQAGQVPPPGQPPQGYGPPPGQVPPQGYGQPPAGSPAPKKKLSGAMLAALIAVPVVLAVVIGLVLWFTLGGDDDDAQRGSLESAAEAMISDSESIGDNPTLDDVKSFITKWTEPECARAVNSLFDSLDQIGAYDPSEFSDLTEGTSTGSRPTIKSAEENGDQGTVVMESDGSEETTEWVKSDGAWKVTCESFLGMDPSEIPSLDDMDIPSY